MNVVLWVVQILLAGVYLVAGGTKLATPREKLVANPQMAWTNDFSAGAIKAIGTAEVLAAVALILPWALDVAP
ncbi:MAG: DoxX family protein, partial [Propionibacteriales bacterium]|nr:DoxX family protein [Propionibacteriales bacterium]